MSSYWLCSISPCFLIKVVKPPFDTKVFEIMDSFFPTLAPVHISSRLAPVTHFLLLAAALATGYTFPALGTDTHFPRLHRYIFTAVGTDYSFLSLGSRTCHWLHISRAYTDTHFPRLAPVTHFLLLAAALGTSCTFPAFPLFFLWPSCTLHRLNIFSFNSD